MNNNQTSIAVRWSDVDMNNHVRHSAYYDYGAHMRLTYFNNIGFDLKKFQELQIGPILFHEECSFIKELHLNDIIIINVLLGESRPDGSRWTLHHEIFNSKGEKAAHITVKGAWIDLTKRKLTVPPPALATHFATLEKGMEFVYGKK